MTQMSEIIKAVNSKGKAKVAITDMDGVLRGKLLHPNKFKSALDGGFGFCNVVLGWDSSDTCYDNVKYTGWHTGYPDASVALDPSTYREIPWDDNIPFMLGDFVDSENNPLEICPRQLLKRVIKKSEALGFSPMFGSEFEWFNFKENPESLDAKGLRNLSPLTPGMFGYSLLRSSIEKDYFNALMDQLAKFNIPIEGLHTETGPGVYEAAIMVTDALEAADRAALFKTSVKEIAYMHDIVPTFMARWDASLPGCSGHLHQSLWKDDQNVFFDAKAKNKMSKTLESYLAGILHCLPEIVPMFAPTVNSYKRLVEGYWAPTKVTWAVDNRTAAVRYIPGSEKSTRIEFRASGSDMNPYLSIACSLAAGLYGIENNLTLEAKPVVGSAYEAKGATSLAGNLWDATQLFKNSKLSRSMFGDAFVDHFAASREWEWRQFQNAVTDWEIKRYFEII